MYERNKRAFFCVELSSNIVLSILSVPYGNALRRYHYKPCLISDFAPIRNPIFKQIREPNPICLHPCTIIFFCLLSSSTRFPVVFYVSSTTLLFLPSKCGSLPYASIISLKMRFFIPHTPASNLPVQKNKIIPKIATPTPATLYHPFPPKNTISKFDFFKICGIFICSDSMRHRPRIRTSTARQSDGLLFLRHSREGGNPEGTCRSLEKQILFRLKAESGSLTAMLYYPPAATAGRFS